MTKDKSKKSKWVTVEWLGPQYSVPVQGGRELYDDKGVWDYGMHVRGDKFAVLRVDAEHDRRFLIVDAIADPPEVDLDDEDEAEDEEVIVREADQSQPPGGKAAQAEADHSIPAIKAALEKNAAPKKK